MTKTRYGSLYQKANIGIYCNQLEYILNSFYIFEFLSVFLINVFMISVKLGFNEQVDHVSFFLDFDLYPKYSSESA